MEPAKWGVRLATQSFEHMVWFVNTYCGIKKVSRKGEKLVAQMHK